MSGTSNSDETKPDVAHEAAQPAPTAEPAAQPEAAKADAGPSAELTAAIAKAAELERQISDLTDRLLRAHADMDNLRKRAEREKTDTAKYAISKFAQDIVGVADNFQRAITSVPPGLTEDGPLKSLLEGVLMTERAFVQALERHGVKRIDPQGEAFNPHLHQAVMEQQNAEVPAGTVLSVFQAGYVIEDRILRPAMVMVAKGGAKPAKPAEANGGPDASPSGET
jgi:molecular chaperone GrpE